MAVLCGLFAWVGAKFQRVRQQRQAIAELKSRGFEVLLEYETPPGPSSPAVEPPGPELLRVWLGDDFFADVTSASSDVTSDIDGSTRKLGDGDLRLLERFPRLTYLSFSGDLRITDKQLAGLGGLPQVEFLRLDGCPVTDAGMVDVGQLRRLCNLDIGDTAITDAGLAQLGGLTSLVELRVVRTAVTERGIRQLKAVLPKLDVTEHDEPEPIR